MNNFWKFSKILSERLLSWSGFSIASGGWLLKNQDPFWRGIGLHFVIWGVVDAGIGLVGLINMSRKRTPASNIENQAVAEERAKLHRLLWINAGLDILYILGGGWLFFRKGAEDENWRGQGIGVIIQGGFLFLFDLWHAIDLGRQRK